LVMRFFWKIVACIKCGIFWITWGQKVNEQNWFEKNRKTPNPFSYKKHPKKKENQIGWKKIHNNTNIDYFYNSGIDYLKANVFWKSKKKNLKLFFFHQ
jgi:hypothetical protein